MPVSVDARTLDLESKLFVTIVPVGTPDMPDDPILLSQTSEPVPAPQMQVMVVPREIGQNEIRLYALPSFGTPVIAARGYLQVSAPVASPTPAAAPVPAAAPIPVAGPPR
jgi:hypothetical protein